MEHAKTSVTTTPLGLTEYGSQQLKAVALARALEEDRSSHAVVLDQLIKNKEITRIEGEQIEKEFLQFAVLAGLSDTAVSPSDVADEYWHQFILNTQLYIPWCQRHYGRFIHHCPTPRKDLEPLGIPQRTRQLYQMYFGMQGQLARCGNGHDCFNGPPCLTPPTG
jgi:hypothetical protein